MARYIRIGNLTHRVQLWDITCLRLNWGAGMIWKSEEEDDDVWADDDDDEGGLDEEDEEEEEAF